MCGTSSLEAAPLSRRGHRTLRPESEARPPAGGPSSHVGWDCPRPVGARLACVGTIEMMLLQVGSGLGTAREAVGRA